MASPAAPFLLAQVSDVHVTPRGTKLLGKIDTPAMLRACVRAIRALDPLPDAVVLTGDLTDRGAPAEYAHLREILAPLSMPVYVIPGNHDERNALRAVFEYHTYLLQSPDFVQYAIDDHPLRIVALDTPIPGAPEGELCERRLEWLERTLSKAPGKPTVVVMHHPPFRTLMRGMDTMALRNPEALAAVIARHPQVAAVLCGHVHRAVETRFAGTIASIAPSCAHQMQLDLGPKERLNYVMDPPAYRIHAYAPGVGVVSHTAYVQSGAGVSFPT